MPFLADLHLHSRYALATSPTQTLSDLAKWAKIKGVLLLGTGDATHPLWQRELETQLEEKADGLYALKREFAPRGLPASLEAETLFLLQSEISAVYKEGGKTRKLHLLFYFPHFAPLRAFTAALSAKAKIEKDGRPTTSLPARQLLALFLEKVPGGVMIPAHVWTPWFSLLGEKSGYDSVEECFGDLARHIPALETGLSSDPAMCRRVSALDRFGLVSFSDAHSPPNIGREACEFDLQPSFSTLFEAMRPGDERFLSTLEFFPEAGKYHMEGHRKCGTTPSGATRLCPVCGKPFTGGVSERIASLADRETGMADRPFTHLSPLREILAETAGKKAASKKVEAEYFRLLENLGPELSILRETSLSDIEAAHSRPLADAIHRLRRGEATFERGYDGKYGRVSLLGKR